MERELGFLTVHGFLHLLGYDHMNKEDEKKMFVNKNPFLVNLVLKDKRKKIGFAYAWNGLKEVISKEYNFRIHLIAAFLVIIAGMIFRLSAVEWAIITHRRRFCASQEMVNSIVERIIDYVKPEYHIQAKLIKDIAAGHVPCFRNFCDHYRHHYFCSKDSFTFLTY